MWAKYILIFHVHFDYRNCGGNRKEGGYQVSNLVFTSANQLQNYQKEIS